MINGADRRQVLVAREMLAAVCHRTVQGSPEHQALLDVLASINDALYLGVRRPAPPIEPADPFTTWLKEHSA